jgi:aminoglycoside 6'-N-acetyltransferase
MTAGTYVFRAMTAADLPTVERWLESPHVREWWGDPTEQYLLVSGDLDEPAMDQFIVSADGDDFAYIQCYDLTAWNSGFGVQPQGTRGIDQFIGEPKFVGCGHGSAFIRIFVERLFGAGAPRVVTDPNPRNARAIRAYAKAGFRPIDMRTTISGEALLMGCDARTIA